MGKLLPTYFYIMYTDIHFKILFSSYLLYHALLLENLMKPHDCIPPGEQILMKLEINLL